MLALTQSKPHSDADPAIADLLIAKDSTIKQVLESLDRTGQRIVFAVDADDRVVGAISDGDVRRGFLRGQTLADSAEGIMQREFVSMSHDTPREDAEAQISDRITVVPLLDADGRAVDFVRRRENTYIPAAEPYLGGNELAYVTDCVETGWISSQGSYVTAFEKAFQDYTGCGHAVSVSNGTVALQLALAAHGIGPGDEVITPDLTFAATLNSVIHQGATPVLVDIHPEELNILVDRIEPAITERTRAIMPVHLYGQSARMDEIMAIADKHDLVVIEDAAEALGTRLHGQHAGTFGHAGTFSFFANKLVTTGEGGMVSFRDAETAARARMLRDHGMQPDKRYWHLEPGFNFRMTNLQAAIGVAQMERIDELLDGKRALADAYYRKLEDLQDILILPRAIDDSLHSFWNFVVLFRDHHQAGVVERLIDFMRDRQIDVRRVFYPMHVMPPYENLPRPGGAENSLSVSQRGLALPASPKLSPEQVEDICQTLRQGLTMLDTERLAGAAAHGA